MYVGPYDLYRIGRAFGATLRAARREAGISQESLADRCDIDRTYPSLLERGLRSPTLGMLFRISEALGIEATRLVAATLDKLRREGEL